MRCDSRRCIASVSVSPLLSTPHPLPLSPPGESRRVGPSRKQNPQRLGCVDLIKSRTENSELTTTPVDVSPFVSVEHPIKPRLSRSSLKFVDGWIALAAYAAAWSDSIPRNAAITIGNSRCPLIRLQRHSDSWSIVAAHRCAISSDRQYFTL